MRSSLHRQLGLFHAVQDAQRHHFLQLDVALVPNILTKNLLVKLVSVGFILHFSLKPKHRHIGPRRLTPFRLTLRYWEGQPLVALTATPGLICSYKGLKKRFKQGQGSIFLI
jgi:hypothetical protein